MFSILSLPHSVLLFHPHISVHLSSTAKGKKDQQQGKKIEICHQCGLFCFMALNELPARAEKIKQVFEVGRNDQKQSMKVRQ